jgi:hypothetical protein
MKTDVILNWQDRHGRKRQTLVQVPAEWLRKGR